MSLPINVMQPSIFGPVLIAAGAEAEVFNVRNYAAGNLLRVMALGTTQHPRSQYKYNADGVSWGESNGGVLPIPVGEFHNPIMTCRDLGHHLDVYETFSLRVKNNDTRPHKYAALVWYFNVRPSDGSN